MSDTRILYKSNIIGSSQLNLVMPPYDPDTLLWASSVVTNGGAPVSSTSLSYVDRLVRSIKSGIGPNLNTNLDRMLLIANADTSDAQVITSLVNPGAPAANFSGFFTKASTGWTGDGLGTFIDTGWNPSTAGGNFSTNDGMMGLYTDTNSTVDLATGVHGFENGTTSFNRIIPFRTGASGGVDMNGSTFPTITNGYGASTQGLHITQRTSSSLIDVLTFTSSGAVNSLGLASTAATLPNLNCMIFAVNQNGTPAIAAVGKHCVFIGGRSMSAANHALLAGYIKTYLTSLGVVVPY